MKKLILSAVILVFSTISANAVDLTFLSLTAGVAANQSVFGASAKEQKFNDDQTTIKTQNTKEGVFTSDYSSQFLEVGLGTWVSLGYEMTPDNISTPTNITNEGGNNEATVSVDFNDMETTYIKLNSPWGLYFKAGSVQVDLDIKETVASGNTYKNTSTEGTMYGAGYQKYIGETGFGFRVEGAYMDLDDVKTDNAQATVGSNNRLNRVSASNLEGLTAKVALTYTLGRN
tara:strand:- start:1530 stop:2219 length:690 start_codon:yes stop_codon:yes gene_type:complete